MAAQSQAHLQLEKLTQEVEALTARLVQKNDQIRRLEDAREEAAKAYYTPQKYPLQPSENSRVRFRKIQC